jgi:Uma2 family endonuclease
MTIASQKMTFEEYLNYDDTSDTRYELVNGELVVVPPESNLNQRGEGKRRLTFSQILPQSTRL